MFNSVVIWEMELKATVHFTLTNVAVIKCFGESKC